MKVNFYATLRQVVGQKTVDFELSPNATVQMLLDEMIRQFPPLRVELLDKNGLLYNHVHIFVNARDSAFLEKGMDTEISPDDVIGVFPVVGGG
jgi:molybdopterin synthase sulfur carrier subunit